MLAAIGETLESSETDGEVMGVVVNVRKGFYRIGLWTKTTGKAIPGGGEDDIAGGKGRSPERAKDVLMGIGKKFKEVVRFLFHFLLGRMGVDAALWVDGRGGASGRCAPETFVHLADAHSYHIDGHLRGRTGRVLGTHGVSARREHEGESEICLLIDKYYSTRETRRPPR